MSYRFIRQILLEEEEASAKTPGKIGSKILTYGLFPFVLD